MKYFHRNSLICALMFSACCSSLYADDKSDAKDNPMAGLMGSMYSDMLDTLSKPETVAKMAHFHKLYFDALIKEGFTREEALRIVVGSDVLGGRSK